jgi:hypothetical protein
MRNAPGAELMENVENEMKGHVWTPTHGQGAQFTDRLACDTLWMSSGECTHACLEVVSLACKF